MSCSASSNGWFSAAILAGCSTRIPSKRFFSRTFAAAFCQALIDSTYPGYSLWVMATGRPPRKM